MVLLRIFHELAQRFPNFFDRGPVQDFKFFRDPPYKKTFVYKTNGQYS